ncbi:MAG: hypothetical protein JJU29_00045 [Verrucomicrobia bacterium]|nr:hypothetical protein [Verrucomicrobiota bacterium]MCH8511052.1 hypothetical protein [Kiritimatiellia bacterium]
MNTDSIHPALRQMYLHSFEVLAQGLNAGDRYPEVWIRDLATFIEIQARVVEPSVLREALLRFFAFQQPDGSILDGFTPKGSSRDAYNFYTSDLLPDWLGHKNSVETDQESSLVIALKHYVHATGDVDFLHETVDGMTVMDRLERALNWMRTRRWSEPHGLVWNATTIDWGDGQAIRNWEEDAQGHPLTPERLPELTELNEQSHPALCIYTNALFSLALTDFAWLSEQIGRDPTAIQRENDALRQSIRDVLWDAEHLKFRPHVYLEKGSPFPADFDENAIHYHGGTAVAMQAGILSVEEMRQVFAILQANVAAAGARSVGLTIWPLYNVPSLNNSLFIKPFNYQNGGDWPWWGARVPQSLAQHGLYAEAAEALLPIARMMEEAGGFHEWYLPDGTPRGAAGFRGAAGVFAKAAELLGRNA